MHRNATSLNMCDTVGILGRGASSPLVNNILKNYLLLEKGHVTETGSQIMASPTVMFLYSKATFSTDKKLREILKSKSTSCSSIHCTKSYKTKFSKGVCVCVFFFCCCCCCFFFSSVILSIRLLSFRWYCFLSNGGNNWQRDEIY